jgi:4-hydroxybenzoate polyprenyltransferase
MKLRRFITYLLDLLMVTRPVLLIPVWGFSALGVLCAARPDDSLGIIESWHRISIGGYGLLLIFSLSVAAVYLLNQLADIEVDKKNGGMPLIARGIVSQQAAWWLTGLCGGVSILIPLMTHRYLISLAAITTLLLGYFYSFRPTRLSGRPIADFLSNAIGYGIIAFGVGWMVAGRSPIDNLFIANALPYFFLMCGGSISSTLPDVEGDRLDAKNTTAVVFGILPAHILAMLFIIAAAVTGYLVDDHIAITCAGLSLPLYFAYLMTRKTVIMESTYKIGGALCMVAAFIALPFFILPACVVFFATWLYFRIRHGISYPSLQPPSNIT